MDRRLPRCSTATTPIAGTRRGPGDTRTLVIDRDCIPPSKSPRDNMSDLIAGLIVIGGLLIVWSPQLLAVYIAMQLWEPNES